MRGGAATHRIVTPRPLILLPLVGLLIAGLSIGFSQATGHSVEEVRFSGQNQLPGLVAHAGAYSIGALALLLVGKGLAYALSLGSFRGGPTFPAIFLGSAAGILMSHLPGFPITVAVAVGMTAGVATILRLPLTAVVIGTVLTAHAGGAVEPLIVVAAVVAYVVTMLVSAPPATESVALPATVQRSPPPPPPPAA
jgi:H+/Cl- antiporter ClcA